MKIPLKTQIGSMRLENFDMMVDTFNIKGIQVVTLAQ